MILFSAKIWYVLFLLPLNLDSIYHIAKEFNIMIMIIASSVRQGMAACGKVMYREAPCGKVRQSMVSKVHSCNFSKGDEKMILRY